MAISQSVTKYKCPVLYVHGMCGVPIYETEVIDEK